MSVLRDLLIQKVMSGDNAYKPPALVMASGSDGCISTSGDGLTWLGSLYWGNDSWFGSCWGDGKYVGVGDNGAMVSGGTYYSHPFKVGTHPWTSVCYGHSKFVAVGGNGSSHLASHSSDGSNWATPFSVGTGGSYSWRSVCYGNSRFVAAGDAGYMATSTDGVSWDTPFRVGSDTFFSVCSNGPTFVAVGNQGVISRSTNGTTWTTPVRSAIGNNSWKSVCWGKDKFVAVGTGGLMTSSPDGVTWTAPVSLGLLTLTSVCRAGPRFVAVGYAGDGSSARCYSTSSVDGISWMPPLPYTTGEWHTVCYKPPRWEYRISVEQSNETYPIEGERFAYIGDPTGFSTQYSLGSVDTTAFIEGRQILEAFTYMGPLALTRAWDSPYFYLKWDGAITDDQTYMIRIINEEKSELLNLEMNLQGLSFICPKTGFLLTSETGKTVTLIIEPRQ